MDSTPSAEKILSFYGTSGLVSLTARRRLEQSMVLARQVLTLKKELSVVQENLEKETSLSLQLKEELSSVQDLLSVVKQPQNIIVERLKERDNIIAAKNKVIVSMEKLVKELNEEKSALVKIKNELSHDLEKLLSNREVSCVK